MDKRDLSTYIKLQELYIAVATKLQESLYDLYQSQPELFFVDKEPPADTDITINQLRNEYSQSWLDLVNIFRHFILNAPPITKPLALWTTEHEPAVSLSKSVITRHRRRMGKSVKLVELSQAIHPTTFTMATADQKSSSGLREIVLPIGFSILYYNFPTVRRPVFILIETLKSRVIKEKTGLVNIYTIAPLLRPVHKVDELTIDQFVTGYSQGMGDSSLRAYLLEFLDKQKKYFEKATPLQRELHHLYSAITSFSFNARLRGLEEDLPDEEYAARYPQIADLMKQYKADWTTLLGVLIQFVHNAPAAPRLSLWRGSHAYQAFKEGDVIRDTSFTSFSFSLERAIHYWSTRNAQTKGDYACCLFHLLLPAGYRVMYHPSEEQIIFPPLVRFRVLSIRKQELRVKINEENVVKTVDIIMLVPHQILPSQSSGEGKLGTERRVSLVKELSHEDVVRRQYLF